VRGSRVSIQISLSSPSGAEPSSMQWETTVPAAQLALTDENLPPGPAAKSAGKTVSCKLKTKTAATHTWICVLFGGQEPIPNGVIAVLRLRILPDARLGPSRIRVDQGLAVTKDLKRVNLDAAETVVTIRGK
jgi:hypothetical protein